MRERRGIGAFLAVLAALAGAAVLTALFTLFSVLALLSIGAPLMPIALLLGFAVAATEPPPNPGGGVS